MNHSRYILFISVILLAAVFHLSVQSAEIQKFSGKLIYDQDIRSKMTVLQLMIPGGKRAEDPNQKGMAYLAHRTGLEFQDHSTIKQAMEMGSRFSLKVYGDFSLITVTCLTKHLEKTLIILGKMIGKPLFSGIRIKRIKRNLKFYQESQTDKPDTYAQLIHSGQLFEGTPYDGSVYGTRDSLSSIKTRDIKKFYRRLVNQNNLILSISTDLLKNQIESLISNHLGTLPVGKKIELNPIHLNAESSSLEKSFKDQKQSLISVAFRLKNPSVNSYIFTFILEHHLGKGIGSKLWEFRETYHKAYHVYTDFTYFQDTGILTLSLKTTANHSSTALKYIETLIKNLSEKGLTPIEFKQAKTVSTTEFLRSVQTKPERSFYRAYFEMIGLGSGFTDHFIENMETSSYEKFNLFVREIIQPDRSNWVIIGPKTQNSDQVKIN